MTLREKIKESFKTNDCLIIRNNEELELFKQIYNLKLRDLSSEKFPIVVYTSGWDFYKDVEEEVKGIWFSDLIEDLVLPLKQSKIIDNKMIILPKGNWVLNNNILTYYGE